MLKREEIILILYYVLLRERCSSVSKELSCCDEGSEFRTSADADKILFLFIGRAWGGQTL